MSRMTNTPVSLTPRWCEQKDILRGWVILHGDITAPRGSQHLRYIKLQCVETKKETFCRVYGPGKNNSYNGVGAENVKKSIFLDAHYQQSLGIPDTKINQQEYSFRIKEVSAMRYYLNAVCHHPDDGVRVGSFLGLVSLLLGLLSICLSILLAGCATALSQQGSTVSPITANEKNSSCQSLGVIVTQAKLGPQKQLSAMNMALNEVASRGGNRILLMTSSTDWAEGSSVTAEALRCNP